MLLITKNIKAFYLSKFLYLIQYGKYYFLKKYLTPYVNPSKNYFIGAHNICYVRLRTQKCYLHKRHSPA